MFADDNGTSFKNFRGSWSSMNSVGVNENDLNHYTFTLDISSMTHSLVVNGSKVISTSFVAGSGTPNSFNHTFSDLFVAGQNMVGTTGLQGRLANVAIWNKPLSSAEAKEVYNHGRRMNYKGASFVKHLAHWYKLAESGTGNLKLGAPGQTLLASAVSSFSDHSPAHSNNAKLCTLLVNTPANITIQRDGIPTNLASSGVLGS